MSKVTKRLDEMATDLWNRGSWGSELDTVKEAKEYIERLENILRKVFPKQSGHYFIAGELGNMDKNGLPDMIEICPAYGADFTVIYEKSDHVLGGGGA